MTGKFSGVVASRRGMHRLEENYKRRLHDDVEARLFGNPRLLDIGITPDNCAFKGSEVPLEPSLNPTRNQYMPSPDLVFLYLTDFRPQQYHLVVLDVKPNTIGRSFANSERQENRYATYFQGMWQHFIINDVKLEPMLQVVPEVNGDVYLSVGVVTKEFGAERYPILWHIQNERLGRMHNEGSKILYSK